MIEEIPSRGPPTTDPQAHAYCLSVHADYQCRRVGACCTAGWHIPVEAPVVTAIQTRLSSGSRAPFLEAPSDSRGPAILKTRGDGGCVFFEEASGRTCRVHRSLGEHMLPSACRQFPRMTLRDPRGTWITLSHFCPTAARLLFTTGALRVVRAPDRLSLSGAVEGLDATTALPPLLRPGMLMDLDGLTAWEEAAVELLDVGGAGVDAALAGLRAASERIRAWSPGTERLQDCVTRTMRGTTCAPASGDTGADARRHAMALASIPRALLRFAPLERHGSADVTAVWREFDTVIRRYLASKIVAGWWGYLGLDLMGVIEAVHVHRAVLRTRIAQRFRPHHPPDEDFLDAIRDTDLVMTHLSDCRALARLIAQENGPRSGLAPLR